MNRQEQAVALLAVAAIERLGGSDEGGWRWHWRPCGGALTRW